MSMEEVEAHYPLVVRAAHREFVRLKHVFKGRLPYERDDFVQIVALELGSRGVCIKDGLTPRGCIDRVAYWAANDELRRLIGRRGNWNRIGIAIAVESMDKPTFSGDGQEIGDVYMLIPDESEMGRDPADVVFENVFSDDIETWILEEMPVPWNVSNRRRNARDEYEDRFRQIVLARYRGKSLKEIGKMQGVSESRVSQVLSEAREYLRAAVNRSALVA